MKNRPDTPGGVNELRMLTGGDHIFWLRESPQLKRDTTIYLETLTPEQQQRLNQIEQELLVMAYAASEETRTKTVLKGK
jgi:hypothetical protein